MKELIQRCPVCSRPLGDTNIDKHHLIPKCHKGRDPELIHKICHRKIHATFTEKELEKRYHSWDEIKSHPIIQAFIEWVSNRSIDFYDCSVTAHRRRKK